MAVLVFPTTFSAVVAGGPPARRSPRLCGGHEARPARWFSQASPSGDEARTGLLGTQGPNSTATARVLPQLVPGKACPLGSQPLSEHEAPWEGHCGL